jgi:hypothetical protein
LSALATVALGALVYKMVLAPKPSDPVAGKA